MHSNVKLNSFQNSSSFILFILLFQIKQTISKLQAVVCAEGRFRVMREALHRCDPPCIPYLGMYLTDLSFIEEGTSDFTPDGLLNFSKMRMVCITILYHFIFILYSLSTDSHNFASLVLFITYFHVFRCLFASIESLSIYFNLVEHFSA